MYQINYITNPIYMVTVSLELILRPQFNRKLYPKSLKIKTG